MVVGEVVVVAVLPAPALVEVEAMVVVAGG